MSIDTQEREELRQTIFGIRRSAWLEMALLYGALILIDVFFLGFSRYMDIEPHPYWIVILPMAAHYGTKEGLLAAIIACIIYLIGPWPEQAYGQDRYDYIYDLFILPIIWLVIAVLIGEIRERHFRDRRALEDELEEAQLREEKIAEAYEQVAAMKTSLEVRTATQIRSTLAAHRALKNMDILNESQAIDGMEQLITSISNAKKFSIFLSNGKGFELAQSYGWDEQEPYTRAYDTREQLPRLVLDTQRAISILNEDHERALGNEAMLVSPIVDTVSGEIFGFIKVEELPFSELNFNTIETMEAIGEIGGMNLSNVKKYQKVESNSMVNPEFGSLSSSYFYRYTDFISTLGKRLGFNVSMLVVKITGDENMPYEKRVRAAKLFNETVQSALRKVDMAFDYQQQGESFSIVMPGTTKEGAEIVREKIQTQLTNAMRKIDSGIRFSYSIEQLHAQ